jgi:aspartyl-tRNA(Asn)/glutamyl-tRNA(Gln) amidotransferase subunit C
MIEVNAALIQKVADLSRLELSEQEIQEYVDSIGSILKHVEQLNSVNTDGIEPMNYGVDGGLRLREDIVEPLQAKADGTPRILESAPEVQDNGFKVPQMVG